VTTRHFLALVLLALFLPGTSVTALAEGGMLLNRTIVVFLPGQAPREDVMILNQEEENLYVSIDIMEVRDPGTEQEVREKVTDPGQAKFVVTPNKLIIPPLGRKPVRLVNLAPGNLERIFRVNVTPVLPPLEDVTTSVVRVVVAYQLLVIVQPLQPIEDLQVTRNGRQLLFENRGNTNFLLSEGTQCDSDGANCDELPTKRIYASNTFEVPLKYDTPVSYKLTASDASRQTVYE
jgi:P pilus assembly chaperone PapD